MAGLYGFLCMLEHSRSYISSSLPISEIWRSTLKPCLQSAKTSPEWLLPAVASMRVLKMWYQELEETVMMEVNTELVQMVQSEMIMVD